MCKTFHQMGTQEASYFIGNSSLLFTSLYYGQLAVSERFYCIIRQLVNSCLRNSTWEKTTRKAWWYCRWAERQEWSRCRSLSSGHLSHFSLTTCCKKHLNVNKAHFHISAKCFYKAKQTFPMICRHVQCGEKSAFKRSFKKQWAWRGGSGVFTKMSLKRA